MNSAAISVFILLPQVKISIDTNLNSGHVWTDICDSERIAKPLRPIGLNL